MEFDGVNSQVRLDCENKQNGKGKSLVSKRRAGWASRRFEAEKRTHHGEATPHDAENHKKQTDM
jgi:hypothetical protein